ncbi:MAG: extracellular solute-binding protein, partial [Bifidobacteriales bacterium]|nr:extracellular solute-binding protein [Bifidobacteriales bacterium]
MHNLFIKRFATICSAVVIAASLAACGGSNQSADTIGFWDPYPQKNASSTWEAFVKRCAPKGYKIKRTGYPQSDLLNNLTTAVKAGNAPQIALIDNPKMPTAVDAGLVTDIKAAG